MTALRAAASLAGVAQVWPCYVALHNYFVQPTIVMDERAIGWLWGGINVFASCAVFVFYVAILATSVPLRVPQLLKNVALLTAAIIGLQNVQMAAANLRAVFVRSQNALQWQYHPIVQLWYVLEPLLPTAWVVFTILFLVMAGRLPPVRSGIATGPQRRVSLVAATALLACAAAGAELIGMLYLDVRFFRLLSFSVLLQVAIDSAFLLFFALMYKAKPSHIQPDPELTS